MHFARTVILIIITVIIVTSNFTGRSVEAKPNGCKYWCKDGKKYYCCSNSKKSNEIISWVLEEMETLHDYFLFFINPWPMIFQRATPYNWTPHDYNSANEPREKEGSCPEIRPFCPRTHDWDQPPTPCDTDDECHLSQKCCYDVCLDHKTCKPSVITTNAASRY